MEQKWNKPGNLLLCACACVFLWTHPFVRRSVCALLYFPTKSGSFGKLSAGKWKPVLSQFLVTDGDVIRFWKIDGRPHMQIMSLWSLMILICICLPANNSALWSNAMLFCSCLSGQRQNWKNRKKSEYSNPSAWRLGYSRETMRSWDLIFLLFFC